MKEENPLPNDVSWDSPKAIIFAEAIETSSREPYHLEMEWMTSF